MGEKKFGNLDFYRILSNYELEHFEEFMTINNSEIDASKVSLENAVDRQLAKIEEEFAKAREMEVQS